MVRVSADDQQLERTFVTLADPRTSDRSTALQEQLQLLLIIRDRLSATNTLINRVLVIRDQAAAWNRWTAGSPGADEVASATQELSDELALILEQLIDVNRAKAQLYASGLHEKFNALFDFVDSADHAPAQQARDVLAQLSAQLEELTRRFEAMLTDKVRTLSDALESSGQPRIGTPQREPAAATV
jgi:hypothetical protein